MKKIMNLIQGDCLEEMKKLKDNSIDSVVCDLTLFYGFDILSLWINISAQYVKKYFIKRYIRNAKQFIVLKNVLMLAGG